MERPDVGVEGLTAYAAEADEDWAAERARIITQDTDLAGVGKTDHFCAQAGCDECLLNTEIQMARNRTAAALESAYRALDYSQVPGNKPPTNEELRLIRDDIASRPPDDLQARQLAWLDARIGA